MKETATGIIVPDYVAEEAAKKADDIVGHYTVEVGILKDKVGGPNNSAEHRQVARITDGDGNVQVHEMGREARRHWRKFLHAMIGRVA
jgi:hypothetical protein